MANVNLTSAKKAKNDEFYTQFHDIEKEMNAYLELNPDVFRDKTILLPCDDPEWSNFTKYFAQNFANLGLKKLISTSFASDSKTFKTNYQPTLFELDDPKFDEEKSHKNGKIFTLTREDVNADGKVDINDIKFDYLKNDGDFRSAEVTKIRDEADIIITNPPFSLFREFLKWIVSAKQKKSFLIIGNMNAITYKEVFPLIAKNEMWLGINNFDASRFYLPAGSENNGSKYWEELPDGRIQSRVSGVRWFTNIDHGRRHQPLQSMTMADNIKFAGASYPKYDNYDAIEVARTAWIPKDYDGVMGVPISFLDKYNPEQFEIVGMAQRECHNNLPDLRKYSDFVQMNKDGTVQGANGRKIDESPIIQGKIDGKTYYMNDKGEEVTALYMRIFIKYKEEIARR